MNWLRTKWGKRVAAALLVVSLLPAMFATAAQAARHTTTYADWVRLQLRIPADEAVLQALDTAAAHPARSLEVFLDAFVEAYEAQQPQRPLAYAFSADVPSNEALISYLKGRYLGFVGEAVVPRAAFMAATVVAKQVLKRGIPSLALITRRDLNRQVVVTTLRPTVVPAFIVLLRTRFAARPMGP